MFSFGYIFLRVRLLTPRYKLVSERAVSQSGLTVTELSAYLMRILFSHLLWHVFVRRLNNKGGGAHPRKKPEARHWLCSKVPSAYTQYVQHAVFDCSTM